MPIIKSAKKRVRVTRKATIRNSRTKRNLKTAVKALHTALKGSKKSATSELRKAQSAIDTAAKKNVLHKNKAARKKRQLAKAAKIAAGVTVAAGAAKVAAKKSVAKKAPASKKPVPKKTAAPKAAAKTKKK